jgi:hypothetical protein
MLLLLNNYDFMKKNTNSTLNIGATLTISIGSVLFSNSAYAQQNKVNSDTLKPIEQKFVPIPATEYTDENYYINLEKAKTKEEQLKIPVIPVIVPIKEDKQTRIENYIKLRDTYPKNSIEYIQIQEKIDILRSQK